MKISGRLHKEFKKSKKGIDRTYKDMHNKAHQHPFRI